MQTDEKLAKMLPRFEAVEWLYDGLKGKIIPWTLENGGKSHDPSAQAFLVARDGSVFDRCPDGRVYSGSSFTKWLAEQAKAYDRKYPRTRVPLQMVDVVDGECEAFATARAEKRPILLYVGREETADDDKAARKQVKAARKFERGTLSSKKAAEAAKGWTLLRLNIADKAHAELLKSFGVVQAPALLVFEPGAEKPTDLGTKLKGPNLAYHLKKHTAAK